MRLQQRVLQEINHRLCVSNTAVMICSKKKYMFESDILIQIDTSYLDD